MRICSASKINRTMRRMQTFGVPGCLYVSKTALCTETDDVSGCVDDVDVCVGDVDKEVPQLGRFLEVDRTVHGEIALQNTELKPIGTELLFDTMVIKVFVSGISGSKEVKKRQQRALLILDSCKVEYESIDITEPGMEESREFMQTNSKVRPPNRTPIAPQFFNGDDYCGDYEDFDAAVEVNQVLSFLKLESEVSNSEVILNNEEEKVIENGLNHAKKEENEPETNAPEETTKAEESTEQVEEETAEKEGEDEEEEEEGEGEKLSKTFPLERDEEADVWGDISQEDAPKKRKKGESGGSELDEEQSTVLLGDTTEDSWGSVGETNKRLKVEDEGSDFFWNEQSNESEATPQGNKSSNEEEEEEEEEEEGK